MKVSLSRWTQGPSIDGERELKVLKAGPSGDKFKLASPVPQGYAQKEQMATTNTLSSNDSLS